MFIFQIDKTFCSSMLFIKKQLQDPNTNTLLIHKQFEYNTGIPSSCILSMNMNRLNGFESCQVTLYTKYFIRKILPVIHKTIL